MSDVIQMLKNSFQNIKRVVLTFMLTELLKLKNKELLDHKEKEQKLSDELQFIQETLATQ
jgi:hypothetical protein